VAAPPVASWDIGGLGDVACLRSFGTVNNLEFDRLALLKRPEAVALDRREVHEDVTAAVAFDETVTLCVVEPLDLACDTHRTCLPCNGCGVWHRIGPDRRRAPSSSQAADTKKDRPFAASAYNAGQPSAGVMLALHRQNVKQKQ
jgi:hypothetical protein